MFVFLSTVGCVDVNGGESGRRLVGSRAGGETHDDDDDDRHDGERRCGEPVALTTCVSEHQLLKHYMCNN